MNNLLTRCKYGHLISSSPTEDSDGAGEASSHGSEGSTKPIVIQAFLQRCVMVKRYHKHLYQAQGQMAK